MERPVKLIIELSCRGKEGITAPLLAEHAKVLNDYINYLELRNEIQRKIIAQGNGQKEVNEEKTGSYRRKSMVVKAFQMTKERRRANSEWPGWLQEACCSPEESWKEGALWPSNDFPDSTGALRYCISTQGGFKVVDFDDWIIQEGQGFLSLREPDIFEQDYEAVEEILPSPEEGRYLSS